MTPYGRSSSVESGSSEVQLTLWSWGIRCVTAESQQLDFAAMVSSRLLVGVWANKQTTTTMTIIHCITYYYICGKLFVTFVVASSSCGKWITFVGLLQ